MVSGTNGNDVLSFDGVIQNFSGTITNPYSGVTVTLDDVYNINQSIYNGFDGLDSLLMTTNGDMLLLDQGFGVPTISNIEAIIAGAGGDVVVIADGVYTYGDIQVSGGSSGDVIWTNIGNDTVNGGAGNDIIDGGPGMDRLFGDGDNDMISGGTGNDSLFGGLGDDFLIGGLNIVDSPDDFAHEETFSFSFSSPAFPMPLEKPSHVFIPEPNRSVSAENVSISYETTIHLQYLYTEAGYRNTLGFYKVGSDGTISNVEVFFKNQHQVAIGTEYTYEYNGAAGESLGMFIFANGWNTDSFYRNVDLSTGSIEFIYDLGGAGQRAATIHDAGAQVSVVFNDGTTLRALNVTDYHSALSGGVSSLNQDGLVHTISGLADPGDPSRLRIGFEDLPFLGDADFDDIVFDMWVEDRTILTGGADDDDYLDGGAGNDTVFGGFGNDIIVAGNGVDNLYGGEGSDIFAFNFIDALVDQIHDFEFGVGGDTLNLHDVLVGFDPVTSAISNFVQLTQSGADTHVSINIDGDIGGAFTHFLTFVGGTGGADLAAMMANGNIDTQTDVTV